MKTLLIVDDEAKIREVLKEYAEFEGYKVVEAVDGIDAIGKVKEHQFDLVIMDVMMPKLDGFSACKEIRKVSQVPILMLSARGEEYDKLFGFEMGIDDYVVKPFSPKEVMARIAAILNRNKSNEKQTDQLFVYRELLVDPIGRIVKVKGQKADLTPKEYDLLFYFVKNRNIALSRAKLLSDVWGYDFYGDDRTVDTHVKMLRGNLGEYRDVIVTVRGLGYKFETEEENE